MSDSVKGFGRRQAYESLPRRNPRAASGGLWGFVLRVVPASTRNSHARCARQVEHAAPGRGRGAGCLVPGGVCLPDGYCCIAAPRLSPWPAPVWRGRVEKRAMPGHGAFSRVGGLVAGGARGWHHRANLSMMIMVPPQQGHGGRGSTGSSRAASFGSDATASSLRASARLAWRAEPASRP